MLLRQVERRQSGSCNANFEAGSSRVWQAVVQVDYRL